MSLLTTARIKFHHLRLTETAADENRLIKLKLLLFFLSEHKICSSVNAVNTLQISEGTKQVVFSMQSGVNIFHLNIQGCKICSFFNADWN